MIAIGGTVRSIANSTELSAICNERFLYHRVAHPSDHDQMDHYIVYGNQLAAISRFLKNQLFQFDEARSSLHSEPWPSRSMIPSRSAT